jgi:CheY-like chemotaxis protein
METYESDAVPFEVLLVEESHDEIRLIREAFKEQGMHIRLHVASDHVEAMGFLRRCGHQHNDLRLDLILLDMPDGNRRSVLAEIRRHPALNSTPIVILTSSYCAFPAMRNNNGNF